jgi:hypothetical protein
MATVATTVTKVTLGSSSIRRVAVLLPPRAPPRTAAVGGGGARGCRRDWRARRRSSACRIIWTATLAMAKTMVMR